MSKTGLIATQCGRGGEITMNIQAPKTFGLKCVHCQVPATHVECGGYKYCQTCAMKQMKHHSQTNIIISLELLQALRGFAPIPDRFAHLNTKEVLYTLLITNRTFGGSLVHTAIFDATFHIRSESSSLIWDKDMQVVFGRLMKRSLEFLSNEPVCIGQDILVKW